MEKKMNYLKYPLLMLLSLNIVTATVYESGDSSVDHWIVYDNKPAGATIENIFDQDKNSNVISFKGDGRKNSYQIGARVGQKSWNNKNEKILKWSMKTDEKYKLYVYATTQKGVRYFYYSYSKRDKGLGIGKRTSYVHYGLGDESKDGRWHDYTRDLEADLKRYEPDNSIIAINGLRVQGSALIDDIELLTTIPENPLITKAKHQCQADDNSTEKILCALENNKVYLMEKDLNNYDEIMYTISTEGQWSILDNEMLSYDGYAGTASAHKLANTELIYIKSHTSRNEFFSYYYFTEGKLKYLFKNMFSIDEWSYKSFGTIENGAKLLIEYYHDMMPNDILKREYDISQLPKVTEL
jgi:hypothetical protein